MAYGITLDTLVERSRTHLQGSRRGRLGRLSATVTTGDTELTVGYASLIERGDYLGVNAEVLYVWDVQGDTVTVERAMSGTTATGHTAGDLVEIAPRWAKGTILEALRTEIRSWPDDLYAVVEVERPATTGADAIDLTGAAYNGQPVKRILEVRYEPYGQLQQEQWPRLDVRLDPMADLTAFPSGYAVQLYAPLAHATTLLIAYAVDFNLTTMDLSTDLEDLGLALSMADIPPLGVAATLVGGSEGERTDSGAQGQARDAEEVPPGHRLRAGDWFREERNRRIADEVRRLTARYPWGQAR